MSADLPDLTLECEHIGEEPQIQHHGGIPFLRCGVLLGLLQHGLEAAQQLQAYGNKAAIHRDCHGTLLHGGWGKSIGADLRTLSAAIESSFPRKRESRASVASLAP